MLELFKRNYKNVVALGLLLLIFTFTISGCAGNEEGLVAKVNGVGITEEEFESDFKLFKEAYEKQFGEDVMSQTLENGETFEDNLKGDIMEKLIIEKLLFQEVKDMKIEVADEEIQGEIEKYINDIGGEEKFEEYLEENQLTKELLEENLRKELLMNKHLENFRETAVIPEEEAKEFFEANKDDLAIVKASHILVQTEEEGKAILKRLEDGEDFASIALVESMDSGSAMNGGELGYFTKGKMIGEFEEVAFSLKPGETSDLVKTEVGYHIIYLEDRKDTYESLEEDIEAIIKEQKYSEKIYELRNEAKVKYFGDFDKKE